MHDILQSLKSLKFAEKGFWKSDEFEDDIFSDFVGHYSSIKVEFDLEDEVSHHTQKYKEPTENKDVNPVDIQYVNVRVVKFKDKLDNFKYFIFQGQLLKKLVWIFEMAVWLTTSLIKGKIYLKKNL